MFQRPTTLSLPNFPSYHGFVLRAVTPRLATVKKSAHSIVLLNMLPDGAAINAKHR